MLFLFIFPRAACHSLTSGMRLRHRRAVRHDTRNVMRSIHPSTHTLTRHAPAYPHPAHPAPLLSSATTGRSDTPLHAIHTKGAGGLCSPFFLAPSGLLLVLLIFLCFCRVGMHMCGPSFCANSAAARLQTVPLRAGRASDPAVWVEEVSESASSLLWHTCWCSGLHAAARTQPEYLQPSDESGRGADKRRLR